MDIGKLPMDIGKLQLLQTLDIKGTGIKELPSSFVQLRKLICLYVDDDLRLPEGMGNLTSLEVLKKVNLTSSPHIVKELSHLTEVRKLKLYCHCEDEDLINMDILIESLGNLQKLQILCINFADNLDCMRESWVPPPHLHTFVSWSHLEGDAFLRLPKWINSTSLPHISTLKIYVKELQGEDLQIIGMLPALRYLHLSVLDVMGTLVVRADAFPSARCCAFSGFRTSACLFPPEAMPRLQHLEFIVSVRSIVSGEVDCGMGHLPSLEYVLVGLLADNSSDEEIETAKAWLRRATEGHPKRPTMEIW